ncbi:hypothetical protein LNP05_19140 [Klebsiella pneumoniae subsp. pneumoniae]|nr:hypothetical protein [Klebsiella pneumoniae subsp. pneumoniae]
MTSITKKTKVNEMTKDFCRIDNNSGIWGRKRRSSLSETLVQYGGQAESDNHAESNNRGDQRKTLNWYPSFFPLVIPTPKVSLLIFAQKSQKSSGI